MSDWRRLYVDFCEVFSPNLAACFENDKTWKKWLLNHEDLSPIVPVSSGHRNGLTNALDNLGLLSMVGSQAKRSAFGRPARLTFWMPGASSGAVRCVAL